MLTSYYQKSSGQLYTDYLQDCSLYEGTPETGICKTVEIPAPILRLVSGELSQKHFDMQIPTSHILADPQAAPATYISVKYSVLTSDSDIRTITPLFDWKLIRHYALYNGSPDKISALLSEATTPAQTRAYGHYDQARIAFDQGHFTEAKAELDAAINGSAESSGYKNEWRFHCLLGVILLGFMGRDSSLIDLEYAVHTFLTAGELAQTDEPKEAAIAYLAAGWASYCRGETTEAMYCTELAKELDPGLGEALYQMAKILIAAGNVKDALTYLGNAIELSAFYAFKSAADGDFRQFQKPLHKYLEAVQKERIAKLKSRITADLNMMKELNVPLELERVLAEFMQEKPLIDICLAEQLWKLFKLKPWFYIKDLGEVNIDIDTRVTVMEPYNEKQVIKPATWLSKEKYRMVTKNRIVEKAKVKRTKVKAMQDTITFFTGRVMADYRMALVQDGSFIMGDYGDTGRIDEKPVRTVTLQTYLIACHQVTQKLWNLVMNSIPSGFTGYDLPVEQVSWYECLEFCNKLSAIAGFTPYYTIEKDLPDPNCRNKSDSTCWTVVRNPAATGYRLPTEAEWEFAARGGNNSGFNNFSGSDDVSKVAWYRNNSAYKTQNVGEKQHNELGIFDMSGNVWEWCWDWHDTYNVDETDNPTGPGQGTYRVIRGGSWADNQNYLRVASRGSENPGGRYNSIGLRIVRNIPGL